MGKLGMSFKVCQTCRYWGGMRDINGMSKLVDAISERGRCNNTRGFYNQDTYKMTTCSHYEPIL